jgi:hypothetical protein
MKSLSASEVRALGSLQAAGGTLSYQRDVYGFGVPGGARCDRIVMQTAKSLINRGLAVATRTITDGNGRVYIDEIKLL